jgi:hypothetical protein
VARVALSVEGIALGVARGLLGLREFLTPTSVMDLFQRLGGVFPPELGAAVAPALGSLGTALDALEAAADAVQDDIDNDAPTLIATTGALVGAIAGVLTELASLADAVANASVPGVTQARLQEFATRLAVQMLEDAVVTRMGDRLLDVLKVAALLGVIRYTLQEPEDDDDPTRTSFVVRELRLGALSQLLTNPRQWLQDTYGFGLASFGDKSVSDPFLNGSAMIQAIGDYLAAYDARPDDVQQQTYDEFFIESGLLRVATTRQTTPPGLEFRLNVEIPDQVELTHTFGGGRWEGFLKLEGTWPFALGVVWTPDGKLVAASDGQDFTGRLTLGVRRIAGGDETPILGVGGGSRLTAKSIEVEAGLEFSAGATGSGASGNGFVRAAINQARTVISLGGGDSFTQSLTKGGSLESSFDVSASYSLATGFHFAGSAILEIKLPVHISLGGVHLDGLSIAVPISSGSNTIPIQIGTTVSAQFGPFSALVDRIGLELDVSFPDGGGNLGIMEMPFPKFLAPTGVGISIDGGAVHGGGFLSFEDHRYSGVLELSVFAVTVKAFGLIETQLPDGSPGFSFVIVIIAEFTPIQLGFGFTLLGVGGLLGVNRSVNEKGLSDAARTGSLEHVLFPHDPVHDAPAIIHDLATIFPAAKDHFIFGPMAKLGWGTPTLIRADLGIIIEFPGPRIAVLGVLRMQLPDPKEAIVQLQMAVAGLLDFPAKKASLDASLFESTVAGYTVTGDMAFRLQWGDNAKFLLSIGGFNTGFSPPAPFPDLRRVSIDLGVSGNPSLVASGYFAVTSNTAQIGSSIQLHASGYGITVDGWMGFDVMFVFSPFSFDASISAGMRVSFHGHGFGITLRGNLTGPTPWHLKGRVCVSILWWDACLPIDVTFGRRAPAALPAVDPWLGDNEVPIVGLAEAISDARNWEGSGLPGEFTVVTLAAASTANRTPIDPLGSATLRQKVAPFNRKLEKFGEYKPVGHDRFGLGPGVGSVSVVIDPVLNTTEQVDEVEVVQDDFAPGHFMQLSNAQKLSLPSYVPMDAGVAVAADKISLGSSDAKTIEYVTKFIDDDGTVHDDVKHPLDDAQLKAFLKRSPAALGGSRRTGTERFMLDNRPKKIRLLPSLFVVADACTMVRNAAVTGAPVSQTDAILALREHLLTKPEDADRFTVVPKYAEAA